MNKYLRINRLLRVLMVLSIEAILALMLIIALLVLAKDYQSHRLFLIIISALLGATHGITIILATWNLVHLSTETKTSQWSIFDYRKVAYYNAIFAGFLIYPALIMLYTWIKSGLSKDKINQITHSYIIKNIDIIIKNKTLMATFDDHIKLEIKNIKYLSSTNHYLTTEEANEYLITLLQQKKLLNRDHLDQIKHKYADYIVATER